MTNSGQYHSVLMAPAVFGSLPCLVQEVILDIQKLEEEIAGTGNNEEEVELHPVAAETDAAVGIEPQAKPGAKTAAPIRFAGACGATEGLCNIHLSRHA